MAAVRVDLHIEQGADWPGLAFPILDEEGQPYDLSGCSAAGQIRPSHDSSTVLFSWSTDPTADQGLITLADSTLTLSVLGSQSSQWTFRSGVYDIELTNPAAPVGKRVHRIAQGRVYVDLEVTR